MPPLFSHARWIWSAETGDGGFTVRRFRGGFDTPQPERLLCHVSADSRYILYFDGQLVGRGPARSDLRHYVYETYTLDAQPGHHTLAAIVVSYGRNVDVGPVAEMHDRGAFLLELQDEYGNVLSATNTLSKWDKWRVHTDTACRPAPLDPWDGYYAIGASETVDGALIPHGWEQPGFDDSAWETPVAIRDAYRRERPGDLGDSGGRWRLMPRDIPSLREEARQFSPLPSGPLPALLGHPSPFGKGEGPITSSHGSRDGEKSVSEGLTPMPASTQAPPVKTTMTPIYRPLSLSEGGGVPEEGGEGAGGEGAFFPPHSRREIILEADEYATGYPVLRTNGGRGATVTLTYAEALTQNGQKGVRDERSDTDVAGFSDTYRPGGGVEMYSPLHWRAFRFLKITVETQDAPLTILECSYVLTGYPWQRQATFTVDEGPPELSAVQDTDFRTLERCTAETFMDCPYYEQLQYVGDTRLQALLSYVTTGDTRLGARAVRLFDWSRLPDGLTTSRYPSSLEQIIPPFSLIWILMVEDLWRYAPGEAKTVARSLPGCRGVLEWFGKHTNADGLLDGLLPWWNFVDWAEGWNENGHYGVPPPAAHGLPSATLNLQYLAALQAYVRLHEGLGDSRESEYWQAEADMLADAILNAFWDGDSRLLREGPDDEWGFTQHAQAWGLLTGLIPGDAVDSVVESLHTDDTLTRTTFYHTFYVIEALAKVGRLERLWDHWLAPWRTALSLNLTTWPEQPEPTRSDCHAWSAWPTYAFLTHVLGVKPVEAGFRGYAIDPKRVDDWDVVSGRVPTPKGLLRVSVAWLPDGNPRVAHGIESSGVL